MKRIVVTTNQTLNDVNEKYYSDFTLSDFNEFRFGDLNVVPVAEIQQSSGNIAKWGIKGQ